MTAVPPRPATLHGFERDERERVEKLVRGAFAWGWDSRDVMPGDRRPELDVRWRDDGEPLMFARRELAGTAASSEAR